MNDRGWLGNVRRRQQDPRFAVGTFFPRRLRLLLLFGRITPLKIHIVRSWFNHLVTIVLTIFIRPILIVPTNATSIVLVDVIVVVVVGMQGKKIVPKLSVSDHIMSSITMRWRCASTERPGRIPP